MQSSEELASQGVPTEGGAPRSRYTLSIDRGRAEAQARLRTSATLVPRAAADAVPTRGYASMTAESLFAYCEMQLQNLDTQMNAMMNKQSGDIKLRTHLSEAAKCLASTATNDAGGRAAAVAELDEALLSLPPGELRSQVEGARNLIAKGENPDAAQWKTYQEKLDNIGRDIGDNMQLNMIEIQSLMAKRQTAIQLTTNLLGKVDESLKTVAQNI